MVNLAMDNIFSKASCTDALQGKLKKYLRKIRKNFLHCRWQQHKGRVFTISHQWHLRGLSMINTLDC
jgi:hypothetical protein